MRAAIHLVLSNATGIYHRNAVQGRAHSQVVTPARPATPKIITLMASSPTHRTRFGILFDKKTAQRRESVFITYKSLAGLQSSWLRQGLSCLNTYHNSRRCSFCRILWLFEDCVGHLSKRSPDVSTNGRWEYGNDRYRKDGNAYHALSPYVVISNNKAFSWIWVLFWNSIIHS